MGIAGEKRIHFVKALKKSYLDDEKGDILSYN